MPEDKEDYSDYLKLVSNSIGALALFSGFTFTAITVLLTRLPDPSSVASQLVLLAATILLDVFLFLWANFMIIPFYYCRKIPPLTKKVAYLNTLAFAFMSSGMGIITVAMFFVYQLTYLALAQLVLWITFAVASYVSAVRPFLQYRKAQKQQFS